MTESLHWTRILDVDALEPDEVKAVSVGELHLAVCRTEDRVGAVEDSCPHQGAALSYGYVEDGRLVCPLHGWQFDPCTGEMANAPAVCARAYPVEVREDGIYVGIPAS